MPLTFVYRLPNGVLMMSSRRYTERESAYRDIIALLTVQRVTDVQIHDVETARRIVLADTPR